MFRYLKVKWRARPGAVSAWVAGVGGRGFAAAAAARSGGSEHVHSLCTLPSYSTAVHRPAGRRQRRRGRERPASSVALGWTPGWTPGWPRCCRHPAAGGGCLGVGGACARPRNGFRAPARPAPVPTAMESLLPMSDTLGAEAGHTLGSHEWRTGGAAAFASGSEHRAQCDSLRGPPPHRHLSPPRDPQPPSALHLSPHDHPREVSGGMAALPDLRRAAHAGYVTIGRQRGPGGRADARARVGSAQRGGGRGCGREGFRGVAPWHFRPAHEEVQVRSRCRHPWNVASAHHPHSTSSNSDPPRPSPAFPRAPRHPTSRLPPPNFPPSPPPTPLCSSWCALVPLPRPSP